MATKSKSGGKSSSKSGSKTQCWSGYERVPGTKAGSKGSCRKK